MNNFIDIGIIVIAIISIIIGWRKGFFKMVFKILAVVIATIITISLLPTAVATVRDSTELDTTFNGWAEGIVDGIAGDNPLLVLNITDIEPESIMASLGMEGWPDQIRIPIEEKLTEVIEAAAETLTAEFSNMRELLIDSIGSLILNALAVIIIWVVACTVLMLIGKILDKFFKLPGLRTLNGLLGGVLGLGINVIVVMLLLTISRMVVPMIDQSGAVTEYIGGSYIVQQVDGTGLNFFDQIFANMLG